MSIKVGRSSTICEYRGGLRECEARSNPYVIRDRTAVQRKMALARRTAGVESGEPDSILPHYGVQKLFCKRAKHGAIRM